jgi:hypothetical protein
MTTVRAGAMPRPAASANAANNQGELVIACAASGSVTSTSKRGNCRSIDIGC